MKIRDLFSSQQQTFSFEFFPPKTTQEVDDLLVRAQALKALGPSFISVTYGAGGSTRRNTIDLVCRFQAELDMVAMAHVTCVGHSQAELREVLTELQDHGVENLMCLRGDPPRRRTRVAARRIASHRPHRDRDLDASATRRAGRHWRHRV